jgi:hypothetical protein
MARKRDLGELLGDSNLQSNEVQASVTPQPPISEKPENRPDSDSMMAQCERAEVWLFPWQFDDLYRLLKSLRRRYPPPKGYRFTRNTLLRVAVALLAANQDKLRGSTEEELFRSLGLDLPHDQPPD